jgi:hypothetical protein
MFLARIAGGGLDPGICIYLFGPEYLEGWKLEFVFLIARGQDPVIYVVLVQYKWRTGCWSLYVCTGHDIQRTGSWNWYLSP